ncbi:RidA family protein [Paenibacillus polymyxa]|nr:RidA family protein [Paenibacillus polymyxa]
MNDDKIPIEAQTRQTLENLDRVLSGFDVTRSNLAYVEIYLTNAQEHPNRSSGCSRNTYDTTGLPAVSVGMTYLAFPEQLIEIRAVVYAD